MLPSGEVPTHSGVTSSPVLPSDETQALSSIADHARQLMGRCVQIVRLGSPLPQTWDSPDGWIALLRERGFRAAYWPLADDADRGRASTRTRPRRRRRTSDRRDRRLEQPAQPRRRRRAPPRSSAASARLALADRVGRALLREPRRLASPTSGTARIPDNLSRDTFALIVDSVREIVDAVEPRRTYYTLEPMPWTCCPTRPTATSSCWRRSTGERFAVHLDPINMINTPAKFYDNAGFLRECFAKLGPHVSAATPRT